MECLVGQLVISILILNLHTSSAGVCSAPTVANGVVSGEVSEDGRIYVATITCHEGFERVGKARIKCMDGTWSAHTPACTRIGSCQLRNLAEVKNARRIIVRPYRGSVVRYKCSPEYKLFGPKMVHCIDHNTWSTKRAPVCVRRGCDETKMQQLSYGQSEKLFKGAVYKFSCEQGAILSGSSAVYCDGQRWNDTAPICISPPGEPALLMKVDGEPERADPILRAGQHVHMRCSARGGNPLPVLTFFRNGQPVEGSTPRPYQNTLTFVAAPKDNGAVYWCRADNQADQPAMTTELKLNVLFPPEHLSIDGPSMLTGRQEGDFVCRASASNLPSELTFKVTSARSHDGDLLSDLLERGYLKVDKAKGDWIEGRGDDSEGEPAGWAAKKTLTLLPELAQIAGQLGDSLTVQCHVADPYNERRILIQDTKTVALIDSKPVAERLSLTGTGPTKVRQGEPSTFACTANQDDVLIKWRITGNRQTAELTGVPDRESGTARLVLDPKVIPHGSQDVVVECLASNPEFYDGDMVAYAHLVEILYPPGVPKIFGWPKGAPITTGDAHKLTCTSLAGNPPARLNWYRGSSMMESHYSLNGDIVRAEVTFVPRTEDNGSELRCEAVNEAVNQPFVNSITIDVQDRVTTTEAASTTTEYEDVEANDLEATNNDLQYDEDDYEDYNDEDYMYEYPDDLLLPTEDSRFLHPELENEAVFSSQPQRPEQDLETTFHKSDKSKMPEIQIQTWHTHQKTSSTKQVFPKDAPYTQTASSLNTNRHFLVACLTLTFLIL